MNTKSTPHNLLPIIRPLEDITELPETYFYDNVVQHLIKDIVRIEANGIPVCLEEVQSLENTVVNVLEEVRTKLQNNSVMLQFLAKQNEEARKDKTTQLESKKKSLTDFIKPFDISNKVHRTYLVNTYLRSTSKEDMCLQEWSIKDLKKLNQIIASKTIQDILDKKISTYLQQYIDIAMVALATDKAELFNKNKIETKIENLKETNLIYSFNPSSPLQKQKLFEFYNVKSESKTARGQPQWNRAELERLQKFLAVQIDSKESN